MTTREQAIKWFNEKDTYNKSELSHKYYKDSVSYNFTTLTGREIEEIWLNELCLKAYGTDANNTKLVDRLFISKIENNSIKKIETENIYLNRLKEQYKKYKQEDESKYFKTLANRYKHQYDAMRLFCLDTQLVSFNDIEVMELEINCSF